MRKHYSISTLSITLPDAIPCDANNGIRTAGITLPDAMPGDANQYSTASKISVTSVESYLFALNVSH